MNSAKVVTVFKPFVIFLSKAETLLYYVLLKSHREAVFQ